MIAVSASQLPWSEWRDAVIAEAQRLDSEIDRALRQALFLGTPMHRQLAPGVAGCRLPRRSHRGPAAGKDVPPSD